MRLLSATKGMLCPGDCKHVMPECRRSPCRLLATDQIQLNPHGNAVVIAISGLVVRCYSWRDAYNFSFERDASARIGGSAQQRLSI